MHVLLDGKGRLVRRILRRLPARLRVRRGLTISTRKRRHSSRPSSEASAVFDVRGGPELGHEGLHGSSAGVVAQKIPYLVVKVDQRGAAGLAGPALGFVERGDFVFGGVGDPCAGLFDELVHPCAFLELAAESLLRQVLRGKGAPLVNGRGSGDLIVRIAIEIPAHLNSRQRKALEDLKAAYEDRSYPQARAYRDRIATFLKAKESLSR